MKRALTLFALIMQARGEEGPLAVDEVLSQHTDKCPFVYINFIYFPTATPYYLDQKGNYQCLKKLISADT